MNKVIMSVAETFITQKSDFFMQHNSQHGIC